MKRRPPYGGLLVSAGLPADPTTVNGFLAGPGANLTNATLNGANVTRTQFRNTTFAGATAQSLTGTPGSLPTGYVLRSSAIVAS